MAAYNIEQIKDKKKLVKLANYGTAERRNMRPKVLIGAGKEKPFIEGDILDANATLNLIEDTYDKGRIFRSFSKEGKKIDKEIKELLEKTNENYEQLSSAIADNKEDADQKIDQLSSKVDNIESSIPNLRRVVDIQLQSVLDGTKTYLVTKQGDVQEQIQISDGEKGEQGEKGDPFTYEDFTPEQIEGLKVKGDRGISISSLEQTQTAYTSGGVNEFTVTLDDGTVSRWYVRNGQKGDATKIWVNANTVHSGYYDSDDHEIKLLNADGGIMSIIDATAFIKDGMISDAYVEDGYIVIVFNTDAGQTPIMIPVTDIFDADDYYTKLDTDRRIAEDVLTETQRAEAAELQLTDNLTQEVSDRLSGDTTLNTKIEEETTRATNAEEALSDAIDAEESTRIQEIDDLQDLLDAYIQSNDAAVQAEITRATTAEGVLQDNIDAEETRATTAEQANATAISTETSRAQSAELALLGAINTEASTRAAAITAEETRATTAEQALLDNIDAEEQRAIAAELDLLDAIDAVEQGAGQDITEVQQALNDEITRATGAESQLSSDLSAEITRATNADNANSTAISNEVSRATTAEQQNASDIDAIETLIPSLATSSNQLADKAFVNSSIATSTATFVGTFNDITDLYAVTTADANDYGYVITTDSAGNTKYNRYKYDGSQWDFEYALNNSSFTAEEWAAILSGMTQALRTKLENLPSTAITSVGVSVPTGLTVTGSPITSSGTIAINFTSGYSIPTTSSLTNWDTAYGWGNHANANYVKSVKVGTDTYNPSSGVVSLPAYPTKVSQLTNDSGYITSYTDTKNTAGTTNKTATKMFLVGATSQAANPQTYSNSNVYIGTDNCLYSNGTKVLTSHQSLSNYVKLDPGTTEQTIKSSISTISKGVINLWRSSGNHVTFLGFSNGTTETYLGGIGFKSQEDTNLYHRAAGGSSYKIWDENNDGARSGLDADLLDGRQGSEYAYINTGATGITKNSDLNDILTAGTYTCYDAGTASTLSNTPYTGGNFRLWHTINTKNSNGQWSSQIILAPSPARMFIRAYEENTFHAWKEFAFITSNVASATKLATARTINGTSFDGSANITTTNWGTARNISITDSDSTNTGTAVSVNGSAAVTLKLPSTIKATLSGNAASATKLKTARTIWGQSFDGSADISGSLSGVSEIDFSNANGTTMDQYGNIKLKAASTSTSYWIVRNVDDVIGIVMTAAGNVGIGTNSPYYKLDVLSTTTDTWAARILGEQTVDSTTSRASVYLAKSSGTGMWVGVSSTTNDGCIANFQRGMTTTGSGGNPAMQIRADGSVCIGVFTATCSTAVGTKAKTATINGYTLVSGRVVRITFKNGNSVTAPTLNISSTGAKTIRLADNTALTSTTIAAGDVVDLQYDGTYYKIVGINQDIGEDYPLWVNSNIKATNSISVSKPTSASSTISVENINRKISLHASTNGGVYDHKTSTWLLATDGTNTWLGQGNVGIDTTSPSYKLHVNGNAAATNFYTTSDLSKKDNITSLSEHIRKFTLKETGKEHYGVIAQEVEEMFREGEEGSYTVNYNSILSYYVGLLENRVAELENKVKELSNG